VIHFIERNERKINEVYVEAETKIDEAVNDGKFQWQDTPKVIAVRGWVNGAIDGPFRLDVDRYVSDWVGGPKDSSPQAEESSGNVYDGQKVTTLQRKSGAVGKTIDPQNASVTGDPLTVKNSPEFLFGFGGQFVENFWNVSKSQSLSAYLQTYLGYQSNNEKFHPIATTVFEKRDGVELVKLSVGYDGHMLEEWWLDPERGYSIVNYIYLMGGPKTPTYKFDVKKFAQPALGIYYPAEVEYIIFSSELNEPVRRFRYHAKEIVVNKPEIKEARSAMTIPVGTSVKDDIEGKIYEVAPANDENSQLLDDLLKDAIRSTTSPTTRPVP